MQYVIIVVLVIAFSFLFTGCKRSGGGNAGGGGGQGQTQGAVEVMSELYEPVSRDQIEERLEQLAVLPGPTELSPGAMCYKVAAPPTRSEYVCPQCEEKTLYASDPSVAYDISSSEGSVVRFLEWELGQCRETVKEIRAISVKLDESRFCEHCGEDVDKPSLGILVTFPNSKKEHCCWDVKHEDLDMILEFEQGILAHKDYYDTETPLKDHVDRLEELLGVEVGDE